MSHSAAPWRWEAFPEDDGEPTFILYDTQGAGLLHVDGDRSTATAGDMALMARAPELLAALRDAIVELGWRRPEWDTLIAEIEGKP